MPTDPALTPELTPPQKPSTSDPAQPKLAPVVIAAVVGFCLWTVVMGIKHMEALHYVSAEHQKLLDNPIRGTSPAGSQWQIDTQNARDSDALVIARRVHAVVGLAMALGIAVVAFPLAGITPRHWALAIVGAIGLTVACAGAGMVVEMLFVYSKGMRFYGQDLSHEARFLFAEIAQWALIGFLATCFANLVYGVPRPWFAIAPAMMLVGGLGGAVVGSIAMATALQTSALAPNQSSVEVSGIMGLACAFVLGVLIWKSSSNIQRPSQLAS